MGSFDVAVKRKFEQLMKTIPAIPDNELLQGVELVVEEAARKYESAAYGGEMNDGGCARIMEGVQGFLAGYLYALKLPIPVHCPTPLVLTRMAEKRKADDAEYAEYQRLRAKYGE